jgi:hypothetical protein
MSAQDGHSFGHNLSSACSALCSSYITELVSAQNTWKYFFFSTFEKYTYFVRHYYALYKDIYLKDHT